MAPWTAASPAAFVPLPETDFVPPPEGGAVVGVDPLDGVPLPELPPELPPDPAAAAA